MAKNKNEDYLLLALVLLALIGKGPLATPPAPKPGDTTSPNDMGGTTSDSNSSPGSNDSPGDMGINTRSAPPNQNQLDPGSGAPDKSKTMATPGSGIMQMMASFMMGGKGMMSNLMSNIANRISPTAPTGGTTLPGGNQYLPGLSITGQSMGGPGPGPYTPSITTVYGDKTYTNFDPMAVLASLTPKAPGVSAHEMMKSAAMPMMIPAAIMEPAMKSNASAMGITNPMELLKTIMPNFDFFGMPEAMQQMVMKSMPPGLVTIMTSIPPVSAPKSMMISQPEMMKQPPGSTQVPNPLSTPPGANPFSDLSSFFMQAVSGLENLKIPGFGAIPGLPGALTPEIMV